MGFWLDSLLIVFLDKVVIYWEENFPQILLTAIAFQVGLDTKTLAWLQEAGIKEQFNDRAIVGINLLHERLIIDTLQGDRKN